MFPFPVDSSALMDERRTEVVLDFPLPTLSPPSTFLPLPDLSSNTPLQASAADSMSPSKSAKTARVDEHPPGTKFPYITGHCANGAHEGSKTLSYLGTLMQSCRGIYTWRFSGATCTCWCHALADTVRAMEDATPSPLFPTTDMPESVVYDLVEAVKSASGRVTILPPAHDVVVITSDPHYMYRQLIASAKVSDQLANLVRVRVLSEEADETQREETGERRRRGELDSNVEIVCKLWLDKFLPWELLTTDAISLMIDAENPPSQGAIYSVLNRWADKGFATIGTKPMRFLNFNENVLKLGLDVATHRSKRAAEQRAKGFF